LNSNLHNLQKCSTFSNILLNSSKLSAINNISSAKSNIEILSVSADSTTIQWINSKCKPFNYREWIKREVFPSSDSKNKLSLNLLNYLIVSETEKYYLTFSSGSVLDIWEKSLTDDKEKTLEYKLVYTLKSKKLIEATNLTVLDDNFLLLLTGGYESVISVYTFTRASSNLRKTNDQDNILSYKFALKGHANSIKDITSINKHTNKNFSQNGTVIATCSQDCYIRLWNLNEIKLEEKNNIENIQNNEIFEEYKTKTSYVMKANEDKYYNILLNILFIQRLKPRSNFLSTKYL
jgi:WD40 repeat protein